MKKTENFQNTCSSCSEPEPSKYQFWLSRLWAIPDREKRLLAELPGGEKEIFHMSEYQTEKLHMISQRTKEALALARKEQDWEKEYEIFLGTNVQFFPFQHPGYPKLLAQIYDPPYGLYVKGSLPLPEQPCVAVVGARECSPYGQAVAKKIGRELAEAGIGVVSGLAWGVDAAAHAGALMALEENASAAGARGRGGGSASGRLHIPGVELSAAGVPVPGTERAPVTFAVMGCGADVCYPACNRGLYRQIPARGGILSEFPMGTGPRKHLFPLRNRIISGLSRAVVVVEARQRSGALITADLALEQNRAVYAVPGRLGDRLSEGTNWLLSQGASPFFSTRDFLEKEGFCREQGNVQEKIMEIPLEKNERLVYSVLGFTPKHPDDIMDETGLGFSEATAALFSLKNKGCLKEIYKNHFIKS